MLIDSHALLTRPRGEGINRGDTRGLALFGGRQRFRIALFRPRGHNRLNVGGVVAVRRADEGVLTDLGDREEFLRRGSAHRARGGLADGVLDAQAVEDSLVGGAVTVVGLVQAGVVHVEGVGILHHELAPAQDARARAFLVAILGLNLVQGDREILVRRVHVLDRGGEHLLVRRPEEHVGPLAVLQPEQIVAVLGPAVRRLVRLAREKCREEQFLRTDAVHLLAHDVFDLAQSAQPQRHPAVDTGGGAADVAGAHQELVARHFRVGGVLTEGTQKELRQASNHG